MSPQSINQRPRRRLIVHGRRMLAAMLCWTALQSVASSLDDGRARAMPTEAAARR